MSSCVKNDFLYILPFSFTDLNINIFVRNIAGALNRKCFTVFEMNFCFCKKRRSEIVDRLERRLTSIKAQRAQNIPRRHLPAILVADQTVGFRFIKFVQNFANIALRFPRFVREII